MHTETFMSCIGIPIYQGKFGANYNCNPTSIVFDSHGNAFVGQADCDGDILKFDAAGNLLAKFDVATEVRGATWIDLAADGCTMFYTSSGTHIKRFDVCENKQLEDFNAVALTNETHTVSILGDGSVLVAANDGIYRFTPMGTPLTVYDISGGQCWYAMAVDSNTGRLFAGDYCGRSVYIFDLNNGALLQQIDVATEGTHVKGLAVATADILSPPRPPTGRPSNPPEPSTNCRITGGGSVFTAAGVRVTHGMQLRAPATEHPQSLQVNWHVEGQTEMHFHLEGLTSATCVDNPNIDPEMPRTRYDTFIATGTGRLNGDAGATIELVFTDGGEPGGKAGDPVPDTATMLIKDAAGTVVLTVSGPLHFGNHQMH
jgi:hypothetical protein